MPQSIKNHQISVTIATVAIVLVFVASASFKVGQEKMGLSSELLVVSDTIASHVESNNQKWETQDRINNELKDSNKSIEKDIGVIKNNIKWMRENMGG